VKSLERTHSNLTCEEMLAYLRWSVWDAKVLHMVIPRLAELLRKASASEVEAWIDAMEKVWSLYYHLPDSDGDLAFAIATTLARADQWGPALAFFQRSRATWGEDGNTTYNMAVCHARLGDRPAALACLDQVLGSTPEHPGAKGLRRELA
jgi:tetratricopeptide (TPR) repeat protein